MATEFTDPGPFKTERGYRFPFTRLDPTPGGGNIGCIEWHVEFVRGRKRRMGAYGIAAVLVWALQTRDERYAGKSFRLDWHDTRGAMLDRPIDPTRRSFGAGIWFVGFCSEHGQIVLASYPPDGSAALVIETGSSVGNRIYFEVA
jgi:hypothetical protein